MSMMNAVISSISKYGGDVTVSQGNTSVRGKGIVEPLRYRNKIYIGGEQQSLGALNRERYLYIGQPDVPLHANASVIESVGGKYIVKRCETYFVQDRPVYVWAIMVPFGARREDDYDSD